MQSRSLMEEPMTLPKDDRRPLEAGDPAGDSRLFRRCLGQYGTGIAIITTQLGEQRGAVTVNSFASVSLDPPLVLWSLARESRSFPLFRDSEKFNVNILSSQQMEVSWHFASKIEDKFASSSWFVGELGMPLLDGCLVHLECEKQAEVEGGDHTILIGRVRRASRFEGEPLLFSQGQYSVPASHPDASPTPEVGGAANGKPRSEQTIVAQIFEAHNLLSARFDEHRRAEGVDIAVARVLACLYDSPDLGLEDLATATFLGQRDTEDAVAELRRRDLLRKGATGGVVLTEAGRTIREAIRSRWQEFQRDQIAGITDPDLSSTIRTLAKLISRNQATK